MMRQEASEVACESMHAPLAPEEQTLLDFLIEAEQERRSVPLADRALVNEPAKYASPIGIDDSGNPFAVPAR